MKFFCCFLCLFISIDAMSRTIGTGEWSLGVSQLESDTHYGGNINYTLNNENNFQNTSIGLLAEHSTNDEGTSIFNQHSKLYQSDILSLNLNNEMFLYKPSLNWITEGNFEYTKLIGSQEENDDWSLKTGPSINRSLRKDLSILADVFYGKTYSNGNESENQEYGLVLNKVFPSSNELRFMLDQECWDYVDDQINDNCIQEYSSEYEIKGRDHILAMMVGAAVIDDTQENIYDVTYAYQFSPLDQLKISYRKDKSNLKSRIENIESLASQPVTVVTKERKIEINKSLSRLSLSVDASQINYESEFGDLKEINSGIQIKYALRTPACLSCSLIFMNRKNDLQVSKYEEQFFGINYPMRRNMIGLLTVRRTKDQLLGTYFSLNFQLQYRSDRALIAAE